MLLEPISSNVRLKTMDGGEVALQDFRGKNTLIFMWASW
ncbi:hypothetical protein [Salsuginibacillus kocurii]